MLKRNSIKDHSNTRPHWQLSLEMRTGWPYGWFWNFFWTVSLKAHYWSSRILTKCNLSWKIVKYRILSEVCMINSTVWPQMWCIKSIKSWFTHPQICWQEHKIRPDLFSKNLFSRPNLLWSRAIMALECDRTCLLFFGCTYEAINSM